ncbi:restriction endonuclease subunit S [Mycobacterium sp. NS-7484]|uniref:restriction endonuclease subunit S n=1 Tax=Mycobacterium sp. NS-7484 TaxID=1834161 RepID=UPI0013016A1D|nr:restriction endonuclease subunit S [Mycobacterium sp. NS-7484]
MSSIDLGNRRRVPRSAQKNLDKFLVQQGDVLFNATNSPDNVGKSVLVPDLDEPAVFSNHFLRLRSDQNDLDPNFLWRWLQWKFLRGTFSAMCRQWVNQATVSRESLLAMEIQLPSLDEQRRIAAILDHADKICAKRRQILGAVDRLAQSIFIEMFGVEARRAVTPQPRLKHSSGWQWVRLDEVAEMATGHTPDRKREDYWNGDIPWISLPEIRQLDGKTAWSTELRITSAGLANSSAVLLPAGTVCFSRTASVGFVTKLGQPMATSQDFHNWIPGADLDSDYLMAALRASRLHLLGSSDGSIHKTIYQRVAERFAILLPPIKLQREFTQRLAEVSRFDGNQKLRSTLDESLFTSLQSRAFRGEL